MVSLDWFFLLFSSEDLMSSCLQKLADLKKAPTMRVNRTAQRPLRSLISGGYFFYCKIEFLIINSGGRLRPRWARIILTRAEEQDTWIIRSQSLVQE
jgi:hypothetical protein